MAFDTIASNTAWRHRSHVAKDELSDHDLMAAAKSGDEDAFAAIVDRYRNQITNFLYRILNDYEEAVDLAQETFVRVYFALERYHTQYAFSTYIYRIASNLAISEIRKRKRRRLISLTGLLRSDDGDGGDLDPPDDRILADEQMLDAEIARATARAIVALPEKYRVPVILRDVQGLSYDEVAEIMQLGLGTTKSRISRGRGLLKDKLQAFASKQ